MTGIRPTPFLQGVRPRTVPPLCATATLEPDVGAVDLKAMLSATLGIVILGPVMKQ